MQVKSGRISMAIPAPASDISDSPASVMGVNDSTLGLKGASDGSTIAWSCSESGGRAQVVPQQIFTTLYLEVQHPLE